MPTRVVPPRDSRAPHSTWHYYQPGFVEPIQAQGYEDLIKAIENFRLRNEIEMGDPEKDVQNYLRHRYPRLSKPIGPDKAKKSPAMARTSRTLIDEVRLWSKLAKQRAWKNIPQKQANKRSAVCINCPSNRPVNEITHCTPCVSALNRTQVILTQGKAPADPIGICTTCMQDNRVAVFMPKEELERSLKWVEETPKECWLREL